MLLIAVVNGFVGLGIMGFLRAAFRLGPPEIEPGACGKIRFVSTALRRTEQQVRSAPGADDHANDNPGRQHSCSTYFRGAIAGAGQQCQWTPHRRRSRSERPAGATPCVRHGQPRPTIARRTIAKAMGVIELARHSVSRLQSVCELCLIYSHERTRSQSTTTYNDL